LLFRCHLFQWKPVFRKVSVPPQDPSAATVAAVPVRIPQPLDHRSKEHFMRKVVCAAVLALGIAAVPAHAGDDQANVSLRTALKVAQKQVQSGILLLARSEGQGARFGFYFLVRGKIREVEVHGRTKKIIKDEGDVTPDPNENLDPAAVEAARNYSGGKLPYDRYLEIAMETIKDTEPSRIEVSLSNGKLVMKVSFGSGDSAQTVLLDMATGKVIKS
jgi:uncharacterized membrane protein YkoI